MCEFMSDAGKVIDIDSTFARTKLRAVVHLLGEVELRFGKEDIGLQSIRSGGAMTMFLSDVSEIIIKQVGQWKSDAFLEYIRKQADSFIIGVSQEILENKNFTTSMINREEESNHQIRLDMRMKMERTMSHLWCISWRM